MNNHLEIFSLKQRVQSISRYFTLGRPLGQIGSHGKEEISFDNSSLSRSFSPGHMNGNDGAPARNSVVVKSLIRLSLSLFARRYILLTRERACQWER